MRHQKKYKQFMYEMPKNRYYYYLYAVHKFFFNLALFLLIRFIELNRSHLFN